MPSNFSSPTAGNFGLPCTAPNGHRLQRSICSLLGLWECTYECRAAAIAALLCTIFCRFECGGARTLRFNQRRKLEGRGYTNDQTGSFSHCAAGAQYASGGLFCRDDRRQRRVGLGFMHEQWKLTTGEAFPLTLTFDGQQPFNVLAFRSPTSWFAFRCRAIPRSSPNFRKAKAMTAYTQGQLFQFNLDQTGQLLPVLAHCVVKVRQSGVASAGDFSVLPAAKAVAAAAPDSAPASPTGCSTRRHRFPRELEWTSRDQCARGAGLRRRHPGQSVRRGARQIAPGVERRDQRFLPFCRPRVRSRISPKSGTRRSSPATAWWRSAIPFMDC